MNAVDLKTEARFFDHEADYSVTHGHLPHWDQTGTVTYITFRTWDSFPPCVVEELIAGRRDWLSRHGIDHSNQHWQSSLLKLPRAAQSEFQSSKVVSDSLLHFDCARYKMFDFVVMPNHVHLMAAFFKPEAMRDQCESWKHFTALKLNKLLKRTGRFWQDEAFDHLIRSEEQFQKVRRYIAENPSRAKLGPGEYVHYTLAASLIPSDRTRSVRTTLANPPEDRS